LKILFVADGRSPIALNWIRFFTEGDHEVHLASTFPASPDLRLASFRHVPVAFSGVKAKTPLTSDTRQARSFFWGAGLVGLRTSIRHWLGPFTLHSASLRLRTVIELVQPDLIHAMRIPYEGMLSALSLETSWQKSRCFPLLISVWGNDFTLHAPSTPWMQALTRLALERASAIHTDCQRDLRLAKTWGFTAERPGVVLPGAGGIQLDVFYPNPVEAASEGNDTSLVVNPRGFRAYVRNDTFFQAISLVLARAPRVRFACTTMAGERQALGWLDELGIAGSVDLLPGLSRSEMAGLFRRAQVAVSPSIHDGTPNTLLEAMACGCFPVAGDLESLREWITSGVNGLLFDPGDPQALAEAILLALGNHDLRARAAVQNRRLVLEKAEYGRVMHAAEEFYRKIISNRAV
jgi:glycosyltransferase involved in cell wall biosynthesis